MSAQEKDFRSAIGQKFERAFGIDKRNIDEEKRTVELSFSSEEPYGRWYGDEILGHKSAEIMMDRINSAGCVLVDHRGDQVGTVDKAWVDKGTKKGRAILRFSKSVRGSEVFQDIVDEIRKNVSVGYLVHGMKLISEKDDERTYRVTSWEPYEISMVGIPADVTVGVGRSGMEPPAAEPAAPATAPEGEQEKNLSPTSADPAEPTPQKRSSATMSEATTTGLSPEEQARQLEKVAADTSSRAAELVALGSKYGCMPEAVKALNDGVSIADFKGVILEKQFNATVVTDTDPNVGMDTQEVRAYSVTKAIREMAGGGLTGLEKEAHDAVTAKSGRSAEGFFIPFDVQARTLQSTVASAGGYTVGTDVEGGSMIEILNNLTTVMGLGARSLTGLQGNIAIPKATGGATAYWLAEGAATTPSNQTFGQIGMTPKRLGAQTGFSKQLLAQSSIDVEAFVRGDLMERLAIAKDLAAINGSGNGEPRGIINTTGVNAVTFGAAPTWAKVVEFETKVAEDNALLGNLAYLTTPGVKGAWKTTSKVANTAAFLWEAGDQVNGYNGACTNQVPDNKVIFGNFRDLIFGDWAGLDIVVDPYTQAGNGQVLVTVQMLTDIAIRHAESFAVSADNGNQ